MLLSVSYEVYTLAKCSHEKLFHSTCGNVVIVQLSLLDPLDQFLFQVAQDDADLLSHRFITSKIV